MSDDIEITEHYCRKHQCNLLLQDCQNCEDGYSHHDCGEDSCACADPENNIVCDWCDGECSSKWCPKSTEQNPCNPETDWDIDTDNYWEVGR